VRFGQWLSLLLLGAALYILWEVRESLLLIFAGVVVANSLNLFAKRLQKVGMRRSPAILIAVSSLVLFIVVFWGLVIPPFADQFEELLVLVPKGIEQLSAQFSSMYTSIPSDLKPYIPNLDNLAEQVVPFVNRLLGGSFIFFSNSLGEVLNILFILVLALMMLANPLSYRQGFIRLFPSFYRRRVDEILAECERSLGNWVIGALIGMGVIALLSLIGLSIIGVKAALANAVLAGLLNLVPNIGPAFSVVPPIAIALIDSPVKALSVLILYIIIQQFESNFLTPYIMSQQVSLLPAVTLVSQVFFATFFGFWGLLLAIPLMVVLQIWIRLTLLEDILDRWHLPNESDFSQQGNLQPKAIEQIEATIQLESQLESQQERDRDSKTE
jgi:predicted PurR-regulated permease PerM